MTSLEPNLGLNLAASECVKHPHIILDGETVALNAAAKKYQETREHRHQTVEAYDNARARMGAREENAEFGKGIRGESAEFSHARHRTCSCNWMAILPFPAKKRCMVGNTVGRFLISIPEFADTLRSDM